MVALTVGCGTFASALCAGTTSSGGAEFIGDGHNPWFIENTKSVTYCIVHDPNTFHLPAGSDSQTLSLKVRKALNFWKREFGVTVAPDSDDPEPRPSYRVATQNFIETACEPGTDVRFQFGVLDSDQIKELGDPQKFLAAYVRTAYDEVNLKGSGFVYLSADTGPLAPANPYIVPMPWSMQTGNLIDLTLVHELGHIFGLGHDEFLGTIYHDKVMGERYVQWMLHPFNAGYDSGTDIKDFHFFTYSNGGSGFGHWSGDYTQVLKFFGDEGTARNVFFDFSKAPNLRLLKNIDHGGPVEVGAAEMSLKERISKKVPTQKLWATQKQSIFPCKEITCVYYGPAVKREVWKGVFTNTNGDVSRHLVLERSPDSRDTNKMRVGGVSESGEIHLSILDELWIPK